MGSRIPPGLGKIRTPSPMGRTSLYNAEGHRYAPPFQDDAVVGYANGAGNNCLIHSISQNLDGSQVRPLDRALKDRCVTARAAIVDMYGFCPYDELELHVWRDLIIGELGGRPKDRGVLCWACLRKEGAKRAVAGGRIARLCHISGPPGHFAPVWPALGEPPI